MCLSGGDVPKRWFPRGALAGANAARRVVAVSSVGARFLLGRAVCLAGAAAVRCSPRAFPPPTSLPPPGASVPLSLPQRGAEGPGAHPSQMEGRVSQRGVGNAARGRPSSVRDREEAEAATGAFAVKHTRCYGGICGDDALSALGDVSNSCCLGLETLSAA